MLIHELAWRSAEAGPGRPCLIDPRTTLDYQAFATATVQAAGAFMALGLKRGGRVAVWLDKRIETVVAMFGAAAAGGAFVPVNPVLKPDQVAHILADCDVGILVTTADRAGLLGARMAQLGSLRHIVTVTGQLAPPPGVAVHEWGAALAAAAPGSGHRVIETDLTAILYTSGSTGRPKGVALSHRNMVSGAEAVAAYLPMTPDTRMAALLPLSFDAGLSQLTTSFVHGGSVVLHNYLTAPAALAVLAEQGVTGLTAVPPLWAQLLREAWPDALASQIAFIANTGGHMPRPTLDTLRARLPRTQVFLMYGLTEAFRSTYLPPDQVDTRPDSIGRAIPNTEILVLRDDGTPCAPMEHGELVHRGPLVAMGYWNDPARTAERYKPLPQPALREAGFPIPELAVFSGDTVYVDAEGYLYFVGRRDDMIKTSGYRVSPSEIEEVVLATGLVSEAAAIGLPHPELGQTVHVVAQAAAGCLQNPAELAAAITKSCQKVLPGYMQPGTIDVRTEPCPETRTARSTVVPCGTKRAEAKSISASTANPRPLIYRCLLPFPESEGVARSPALLRSFGRAAFAGGAVHHDAVRRGQPGRGASRAGGGDGRRGLIRADPAEAVRL